MKILELTGRDEARFDELALSHGSIFNTTGWTRMFGSEIRNYGIYSDGCDVIGGFMVYETRKFGISIYRNPPFTPTIGPFLKIEASNPVVIMDRWKEALSLIAEHISGLGFSVVSIALDRTVVDTQPFIWRENKVVPEYTYVLDLTKTQAHIMKEMSPERRKNINKALRDGLLTRRVTDYGEVKLLANKTFARQGMRIDQRCLDKILFEFANEGNSFAFATLRSGTPIACSFCIYDRSTAYYLIGGYDSDRRHHGAGALSMWESIKHAQALGLRNFDFEGSMVPKIETYFRGFGGRLRPYYRVNKATLPIEILLKFFKRRLF